MVMEFSLPKLPAGCTALWGRQFNRVSSEDVSIRLSWISFTVENKKKRLKTLHVCVHVHMSAGALEDGGAGSPGAGVTYRQL